MSSTINMIYRFHYSYFSTFFKQVARRPDLVGKGKIIEQDFKPFKVTDSYTYPNLYGVTFRFIYNVDDDLKFFTLEWITPDGVKRRQKIRLYFSSSNLGNGKVGYFLCPRTNRPCRKLYTDGIAIASRYAFPHHYSYQYEGRKSREYSKLHRYGDEKKQSLLKHRQTYKGKPTRWAKRLEEVEQKEQQAWDNVLSLDKHLRGIALKIL